MAKKTTKKKASKKASKKVSKVSSKKRAVSHAGARAKGLNFERQIATALGAIFPDAQRRLEYQASQVNGSDLDNTGPFRIQCKRFAGYASISKIREVREEEGTIPVLVTKGNKMKAVACLYFEDFIDLLTRIFGVANEKLVDLSREGDIEVQAPTPLAIEETLFTEDETIEVESPYKEYPSHVLVEDGSDPIKGYEEVSVLEKDIEDFM